MSIRIKVDKNKNRLGCFGKYGEVFLDSHLPTCLKRKVFNQGVLPAITYGCQTWSLTKALVKKLETSQAAMGRKMLNDKLKDRIRNTIIRQRTRVTDIVLTDRIHNTIIRQRTRVTDIVLKDRICNTIIRQRTRVTDIVLKDRIRNTIIRQRTRVTDIVQYVTNVKWKWAAHITQMQGNRRTIRSTEWQVKGVRSVGRPNVTGEMTLWGNRERYGQGQQRTEKVGGLWRRATSCSGRTQPRIA